MDYLRTLQKSCPAGTKMGDYEVAIADDFEYTDPIDGSVAKGQVKTHTPSLPPNLPSPIRCVRQMP